MKEKNYVHFLHKPHTHFLPERIMSSGLKVKKGKATPDSDYLHVLIYSSKLFRYCSDGWIPVESKIVKIYSLTRTLFFTPLLSFCMLFLVIPKTIGMPTEVVKVMPKGTSFHPWKNCRNFWDVPICPGLYKLWSAMKMTWQCNHSCIHLLSWFGDVLSTVTDQPMPLAKCSEVQNFSCSTT